MHNYAVPIRAFWQYIPPTQARLKIVPCSTLDQQAMYRLRNGTRSLFASEFYQTEFECEMRGRQ